MAVPNFLQDTEVGKVSGVPVKKKASRVPNFIEEPTIEIPKSEVPLVLPKDGVIPGLTPSSQPKVLPEPKLAKPFFEETLDKVIAEGPKNQNTILPEVDRYASQIGGNVIGGALKLPKAIYDIPDIIRGNPIEQEGTLARLSATGDKVIETLDTMAGRGAGGQEKQFSDKLAGGFGNLLSNFIPAGGVGGVAKTGVSIISKSPQLAKYAPAIGTLFAQGTLNAVESSQEAGQVYNEVLLKTRDMEKAADVAQGTFGANVVLSAITNKFSGFFDALPSGAKNAIKRALSAFVFEGGQESGQQIISNYATGRPLMDGVKDSALIGGILGSGAALGTANIYNQDGTVNKDAVVQILNDNQIVPINIDTTPGGNVNQEDVVAEQIPQERVVPNFLEEQVTTTPDVTDVAIEEEMNTPPVDEQIASVNSEITPLIEQFNDMPDLIKDGPDGKALQDQIENLNQKVSELVTQQEISNTQKIAKQETKKAPIEKQNVRLIAENVTTKDKEKLDYDPERQIKIGGEVMVKPKSILSKTDLRSMLKAMDVESIDVEVGDGNTLLYKDGKREMRINQSALGLFPNALKVGEKVTISREDLDVKGTKDQTAIRAVDREGNVLASKKGSNLTIDEYEKQDATDRIPQGEEFKIYRKMAGVINKFATRIAEGNVKPGALGTFDPSNFTIRIKGLNDVSTLIHEVTHHIDFFNFVTDGAMKVTGYSIKGNPIYEKDTAAYRKALTDIYLENYPGAKAEHSLNTRLKEGYAMLLERYIEAPKMTTAKYEFAVKEFLLPGGKFYKPVVTEYLNDLRSVVGEYQNLSPIEKIGARVTEDNNITGKESFLNVNEKLDTEVTDAIYPIEKLSKIAGTFEGGKDPSKIIRHYSNVNSYFANNVRGKDGYWSFRNGEFKKVLDYNWGDMIKKLEDRKMRDKFDYFLVARRNYFDFQEYNQMQKDIAEMESELELLKSEKDPDNDNDISLLKNKITEAKERASDLGSILKNNKLPEHESAEVYFEYKEKFAEEEKMFDALSKADLDLLASEDIGLINQEEYKKLSEKEGYASFKREFYNQIVGDDGVQSGVGAGKGKVSSLKSRKGSSRTIISPTVSGVKNHSEILQKAMKQYVYNRMLDVVKTGKVDQYMELVPVQKIVDKETGAISYPQEKQPNIIMARSGGRRYAIQADAYIKNVLDNVLDYSSVGPFEKVFQAYNRMFTKGTTSAFPPFALTNLILDQFTAWSNTEYGFKPFITPLKTLYKAVLKKQGQDYEYWREYLTLVGDRLAIGKSQEMSANELAEFLTGERKSIHLKLVDFANSTLDFISAPAQFTESLTRASEYILARKKGKSQVEAMAMAAELTGDFRRIGNFGGRNNLRTKDGMGRTLVKSVPYFNAGIQVTRQVLRTALKEGGTKRLAFVVGAMTAANIASMALLVSEGSEEDKELYQDISAAELSKYIFLPNPAGGDLIKIRMPDIFVMPSAVVNMLIATAYFKAKYNVDDYVDAMTSFLPTPLNIFKPKEMVSGWLPQIVKPWAKVIFNYDDFPRIRPLEGAGQQRKPAEYRFTQSTPAITKELGYFTGKYLGLSPIQLDALIVGHFGRLSNFATGKPGVYNPATTFTQKHYFEGGRRMQPYFSTKEAVDQDYSYNKIGEKVKNGVKLTEDEQKTLDVYRAIHGYSESKKYVKDNKILGIEDYLEQYKEATEKNDVLRANVLIKKISSEIEKLNKYGYK